jgi:3,4-dihydroxy 2-butanone 4-phosphate synthase/GTP cyclohydrolase II
MVNDAIQRVRHALAQPGVTAAGLARKAGLHPNTLYGADKDGWNPNARTLIALEPHLPPIKDEAVAA